jgi:hypothetical protein
MAGRTLLVIAFCLGLLALPAGSAELRWDSLYADGEFSEQAKLLDGAEVTLTGYMAPPLKANSKFWVMGDKPMTFCPFCATAEEWPSGIVVVYPTSNSVVPPDDRLIAVTGKLMLGLSTDPETGYVSKVRLINARYRTAPNAVIVPPPHG